MKIFGQIVRTAVNVATLPVSVARDTVMLMADASDGKVAPATRANLERLKREAGE